MSRLIWSPNALQDVQRVYRFLALKNLDAARRAVKAIRAGVKVLQQQQPGMGRPVEKSATHQHPGRAPPEGIGILSRA
jgi:plasmid stabilization system protein ParE